MNKILALDQASKVSGYAVFQEDGKLITHGKFVAEDDDIGDRLVFIRQQVLNLIKQFDISYVVMEDILLKFWQKFLE